MLGIDNVVRRFGRQTVLNRVSLEVPTGKVACLVGPSGCGKSTLLRLVAGLDRPDDGQVRLRGTVISSAGWALEAHKRGLNMVFQDYALWPHMTVERIIGYGLKKLGAAERDARVKSLLDLMQIAPLAGRLPSQISGGQQQRVAIARALATDPDLLLLDEPLSNLDVQLRLEMRKEFSELFKRVGKTVLYVTHDPLEACSFADMLVVMKSGEIEQVGSPETLFAAPRSRWIATLAGFETRMEGKVIEADPEGRWSVLVGDQRITVPQPAGIDPAYRGAVTVMLHPASIDMGDGGAKPDTNTLAGTVTHCLYEGRLWRTVLDVVGGSLSLMSPARLAVGGTARISFRPDAVVVFPA